MHYIGELQLEHTWACHLKYYGTLQFEEVQNCILSQNFLFKVLLNFAGKYFTICISLSLQAYKYDNVSLK